MTIREKIKAGYSNLKKNLKEREIRRKKELIQKERTAERNRLKELARLNYEIALTKKQNQLRKLKEQSQPKISNSFQNNLGGYDLLGNPIGISSSNSKSKNRGGDWSQGLIY